MAMLPVVLAVCWAFYWFFERPYAKAKVKRYP